MTKWILGILALLALAMPSFADAEPAATAEADLVVAKAFWGREPTGCSSIAFSTEVHQGPDAGGEATEPAPGATPIPCTIAVREVWSSPAESPVRVCLYAVHEWGHLLGEGHSPDPNSVMYFEPSASSVPACENWVETPEGQATVARRQAWQEWREFRGECITSRGPFRPRCWRLARRKASQLTDHSR